MRKFIKNTIYFLLPVFLVAVFLFLYLNVVVKQTKIKYKLNSKINIIAIGDSHIQQSLNDSILFTIKNLANSSESFVYSYYKLIAITKNNPQIDTIFLGASYHSFSKYYDDFTYNSSVLKKYFYILPFKKQLEMIKKINDPFVFIISSFKILLKPSRYYDWIGYFNNYSTNVSVNEQSIVNRINFQYYKNDSLYGYSKDNISYFYKIVQFCKVNKIELIIVNTPLHKSYQEKIPKDYINKFYSLVSENNLSIIEFDKFSFEDADFLPDGDHVSKRGSEKSSKIIDSLLNNREIKRITNNMR